MGSRWFRHALIGAVPDALAIAIEVEADDRAGAFIPLAQVGALEATP